MDVNLIAACRAVHDQFMPAEATADRAAAQTARLLATILEQRAASGLAIGTGAPLIRKLSKSLTAQLEAREEFIMAHKIAATIPHDLGIDPIAYGDTEPCPPDDPETRRYYGNAEGETRQMISNVEPDAMSNNILKFAAS